MIYMVIGIVALLLVQWGTIEQRIFVHRIHIHICQM